MSIDDTLDSILCNILKNVFYTEVYQAVLNDVLKLLFNEYKLELPWPDASDFFSEIDDRYCRPMNPSQEEILCNSVILTDLHYIKADNFLKT
ncbi:unnamed protein product [Cunninghamella blakesleeana]